MQEFELINEEGRFKAEKYPWEAIDDSLQFEYSFVSDKFHQPEGANQNQPQKGSISEMGGLTIPKGKAQKQLSKLLKQLGVNPASLNGAKARIQIILHIDTNYHKNNS